MSENPDATREDAFRPGYTKDDITPRNIFYRESALARLPRLLTRTEHFLLMEEVVDQSGSLDSVIAALAQGVAQVYQEAFSVRAYRRVAVFIGPGWTGCLGWAVAAELARREASVTAVALLSEPQDMTGTLPPRTGLRRCWCEQHEAALRAGVIETDFVPSTLDYYYDALIDAIVGVDLDVQGVSQQTVAASQMPADAPPMALLGTPYDETIDRLAQSYLPLLSLDVPSGWDTTRGPLLGDLRIGRALKPEVLVSVLAPKRCLRSFGGNYWYLVGNVVPEPVGERLDLRLPAFPTSKDCVLMGSNPFLDLVKRRRRETDPLTDEHNSGTPRMPLCWGRGAPGEVYGRPGEFLATVFNPNPRRVWVDPERDEDGDLWDELE